MIFQSDKFRRGQPLEYAAGFRIRVAISRFSMRAIDFLHRKPPIGSFWSEFKKLKLSRKIAQKPQNSGFVPCKNIRNKFPWFPPLNVD